MARVSSRIKVTSRVATRAGLVCVQCVLTVNVEGKHSIPLSTPVQVRLVAGHVIHAEDTTTAVDLRVQGTCGETN